MRSRLLILNCRAHFLPIEKPYKEASKIQKTPSSVWKVNYGIQKFHVIGNGEP